jgi:hypothetical protein
MLAELDAPIAAVALPLSHFHRETDTRAVMARGEPK